MLTKLDLAALLEIDGGRVRIAFERALAECQGDLKDRPGLKKARKLTLTCSFSPQPEEGGRELEMCDVRFSVKVDIPKRESKVYSMKAGRGGLVFNEDSPEDVNQATLGFGPKPTDVVGEKDGKEGGQGRRKAAGDAR